MPVVVSDTSPIRALAHLQLMDLLGTLFGQVLVPPAVQKELQNPPAGFAVINPTHWSFVQVQAPKDQTRLQQLQKLLDAGEAEAITLALEIPRTTLLIDEAQGRAVAKQLAVPITGTLGVLLEAKARTLIPVVASLMDSLEKDLNFFIAPKLRADILRLAGE